MTLLDEIRMNAEHAEHVDAMASRAALVASGYSLAMLRADTVTRMKEYFVGWNELPDAVAMQEAMDAQSMTRAEYYFMPRIGRLGRMNRVARRAVWDWANGIA